MCVVCAINHLISVLFFFYGDAVSLKSILDGFSALCMINEGVELLPLWFYFIMAVEIFVEKPVRTFEPDQ